MATNLVAGSIVCNETIDLDVWGLLLYHYLQQNVKRHKNNTITSMILYKSENLHINIMHSDNSIFFKLYM